jgi:hypothetical protein
MNERAALWEAYRRTTYVAYSSDGDIRIDPGRRSLTLDALLDQRRIRDWAYVTAYNPESQPLDEEDNVKHQEALVEAVRARGLPFLCGKGIAEDGTWVEPSILILGIESDDARALGRQFGQLAILVGQAGQPARLVACGEPPA